MNPVKIYLDHKDYVGITGGLLGDANHKPDVETFELLQQLVDEEKVVVYFSWVHICEVLKYDGTSKEVLDQYCEVIESLTKGNCLYGPLDLRKRELEVFLSEEFGVPTVLSRRFLAYGKYSDALFAEPPQLDEPPIDMLKNSILNAARNRKERKHIEKLIANPIECKKLIRQQLEQANLEELKGNFPSSEDFYSVDHMSSLFGNDPIARKAMTKSFMDGACSFRNLVTYYSSKDPELKLFASSFDIDAQRVISNIRYGQQLYGATGRFLMDSEKLLVDLVERFSEHIRVDLSDLTRNNAFSIDDAVSRLKATKLSGMPSVSVVIAAIIEYVRKHKGDLEQGRLPSESDLRDLFHLTHIPYADCYLTDKFFSSIARKSSSTYSTSIFRSLSQLRHHLKSLGFN